MTDVSRGSIALRAFMDGEEGGDVTREGVREVLNENRRLRAILAAMSKGGLGDGAMAEIEVAPDPVRSGVQWKIVVCAPDGLEEALGGAVSRALHEAFPDTVEEGRALAGVSAVIALVAALDEARLIGVGGRLPWHLPADLARFRALTDGHIVAGGSGTWESIGKKLDNRMCVTLSRDPAKGRTLQETITLPWWFVPLGWFPDVFIIGGASVYAQALPMADVLYLTRIHHTFAAGDGAVYFPAFEGFRLVASEERAADDANPWAMAFEERPVMNQTGNVCHAAQSASRER